MTTNNPLSLFNFNHNEVRVVTIDSQPWFVAKDVCNALGIKQAVATVRGMAPQQW